MKTKEQIKELILQNCVNEHGDIDMSGLDFTDFNGHVYRDGGKVNGNLSQSDNEVGGKLLQGCNKVEGDLSQVGNEVKRHLYQGGNKVEGDLYQNNNKVGASLAQNDNEVKGMTHTDFNNHNQVMIFDDEKGGVEDKRFVRQLEDMSKEELIEKIRGMEKDKNE